eukprot:5265939-Ditylum_brightwellii.AAC.1
MGLLPCKIPLAKQLLAALCPGYILQYSLLVDVYSPISEGCDEDNGNGNGNDHNNSHDHTIQLILSGCEWSWSKEVEIGLIHVKQ